MFKSMSLSHELFDSKEMSTTIGNGYDDSIRDLLLSSRELADCKLALQAINGGKEILPICETICERYTLPSHTPLKKSIKVPVNIYEPCIFRCKPQWSKCLI